jgi:uncharacterized protein (TIGR03437 family)
VKRIGPVLFPLGLIAATLCCLDTVDAQTNTVVASPPQLTFNTQTGVTTPAQTVLLNTSSGVANISVTSFSENSWLQVSSSSSTTPALLTVSIGAGAPTSGVAAGFINVQSGTSTLSIPVTLNANSGGVASPISGTPNSLSFVFAPGSTAEQTQTVSLASSNSAATNFTATPVTYSGSQWLIVNPGAGSLPGTLQVSVNPGGLLNNPGTFDGAVAVNAPGTTGIIVPVLVTIQGTPSVIVSPSQLSFGYQVGTAVPTGQTLTLTSSTGVTVPFTASAQSTTANCGNWIVLSQNSGATPSTLTVEANTVGLASGVSSCTGNVVITATTAATTQITIPVTLLVSTLPLIEAPTTPVTFNYQLGGVTPSAQTVQITSTTSGLPITVSAAPTSAGTANFLEVTPATGTTSQALTLSINSNILASLGPGTYSETVTISGAAGNSPQTFAVALTVSSNPGLTTSLPSLNFNYQVGGTLPAKQSQTITVNSSGAPLNYQVAANTTNCSGFLSATPASGGTLSANQNQVIVSVNAQGITPQVCSGNVTLTVPGSTAAPLVIPVTFNVSNTVLLNLSQSAISLTAIANATAASTQSISVTSTNGTALPFTATATTSPAGLAWLAVTPNSGSTPSNLQVTINPAGLGIGVYTGSINVSSSTVNVPAQTIAVTLTVVSSTATASQTSLTFTQAAGAAAPNSQSFQIAGVPSGTTIGAVATVLSGQSTNWLTATVSGNTVTVTANGSQLAQGTYSGVVTVLIPGAGGSPLYVPVTLNVTATTSSITLSSNTATFNIAAGSTSLPGSQTVQVTSTVTGSSEPFAATFIPSSGGNFLTVSPTSGNTSGTLTLALNSSVVSTLAAGTYTGDVQVTSGTGAVQTVLVTLTVSPAGTPIVGSIDSAASFQSGTVSPGEIVTIFGSNLGPATPALGTSFTPTGNTVPTTLANVSVTFNNVPAPIIFVAPGQINAIVPYEVAGQTSVPVVVKSNGITSASFTVQVAPVIPAIFSLSENGNGQGAILNSDASVNGSGNPAAPGSIISIYATGEGQIVPAGATGCITGGTLPLPTPVGAVSVTIGGEPATPITYAGEAPDEVCGIMQINATVPSNLTAGAQPVVLTIGTATNSGQAITVVVK